MLYSAYMAQFSDSSLENISEQSEEELLKFAKKQVAMFHKHSDGSDVHLVREKGEIEAKIEGEEKNYTPDHGPIRLLCTCGKEFELSSNGREDYAGDNLSVGYSETKDAGYKKESGYK